MYSLTIMMDLKYEDIQTFLEVYKAGTFTKASKGLGLTQSALSQKVARLEETLQTSVFIRNPRSLELTSSGEELLIYAKEAVQRQQEFLSNFTQDKKMLSGVIRIAGYSSIMRSIILPKIAPFLRKHPNVSIEMNTYEVHELKDALKSNQADLIITDFFPNLLRTEEVQINKEEYIVIKSKKYKQETGIFLDHDILDNATDSYFKSIEKKKLYKRVFLGDVYSIIDGVALGLGMAVMPKHLVDGDKRFEIEKNNKKYIRPVVLSYLKQGYYSPLHKEVTSLLLN